MLSVEHCWILLRRYFAAMVDQWLCFVFDSSEIRCSVWIWVCWCLINRQCSILVGWAVEKRIVFFYPLISEKKCVFEMWYIEVNKLTSSTLHSNPPWKLSIFKFKSSKLVWLFKASINWPISVDGMSVTSERR